jgi:hypothetical protein
VGGAHFGDGLPHDRDHLVDLRARDDERRRDHAEIAQRAHDQPELEAALVDLQGEGLVLGRAVRPGRVEQALHATHEAHRPGFRHARQIAQRSQRRGEIVRHLARLIDDALALHQLDVGKRRGAGHRLIAVGIAVGEPASLGILARDPRQHRLGDRKAAERHIARGHALGEGDDVRHHPEHLLRGEPLAATAEARHHLVRDIEDVVLLADRLEARMIACGRNNDAARGEDRLGQEGRDRVGAEALDPVLEFLHQIVEERLLAAVAGVARIGAREERDPVLRDVEVRPVAGAAGAGGGERRRAVIAVVAHDDALLLRPAQHVVVEFREAQRAVHRGRPARGEKDPVEIARRQRGDLLRQPRRGARGHIPGRGIGQHHRLMRHGIDDLAAAVAHLRAPHARRPVDQAAAVLGMDIDALGMSQHRLRGLAELRHFLCRQEDVIPHRRAHRSGSIRRVIPRHRRPPLSSAFRFIPGQAPATGHRLCRQ